MRREGSQSPPEWHQPRKDCLPLSSLPLQGGLSRGRPPRVPQIKGQQTACLLGHASPCSSCCPVCVLAGVPGRIPATNHPRARFALCHTGWNCKRPRQSPSPGCRTPWTVAPFVNLPPPSAQAGSLVHYSLKSPALVLWAGLQGALPTSHPHLSPPPPHSPAGHPRPGLGLCKVAYLLSF